MECNAVHACGPMHTLLGQCFLHPALASAWATCSVQLTLALPPNLFAAWRIPSRDFTRRNDSSRTRNPISTKITKCKDMPLTVENPRTHPDSRKFTCPSSEFRLVMYKVARFGKEWANHVTLRQRHPAALIMEVQRLSRMSMEGWVSKSSRRAGGAQGTTCTKVVTSVPGFMSLQGSSQSETVKSTVKTPLVWATGVSPWFHLQRRSSGPCGIA